MAILPNAEYSISKQKFLNSVINKIGKQEYSSQGYTNPLKRFIGGFIENASDIEEIYVHPVEGEEFDDTGSGVLDKVTPTVNVQYHTNTEERAFKRTVQDKEFRRGFRTSGGVQTMADHLIQGLHTGKELWELQKVKDVLKAIATGTTLETQTIEIAEPTDSTTSKNFYKSLKKIVPKIEEWNELYQAKPNYSKRENLILIIDSDVDVEIQTEYLAPIFNMSVADFNQTSKLAIPNLKTILGDNKFAMLIDTRCIKIHPTYYNVESIRNTRGKFTNYDLVVEYLLSYTNWYTNIVFKSPGA